MEQEMYDFLSSVVKKEGMPKVAGGIFLFGTTEVTHYNLEWTKAKPPVSICFVTNERFLNPTYPLPVLDFSEALVKMTIGSFPY